MLYTSITNTRHGNYQLNHRYIEDARDEILALGDVVWSKIIRTTNARVVEEYSDGEWKEADNGFGKVKAFIQDNIDSIDESMETVRGIISDVSPIPTIVSTGDALKKLDAEKALLVRVKNWIDEEN